MKIKAKIWLEDDSGQSILGNGRLELLRTIDETGSLRAATERLGMSYRHAWGQIRKMEERMNFKLLEPTTGGKNGGGSVLTAEAVEIIKEFDRLQKNINEYVEKKSSGLFE